jgi:hypothetical protein
MRTIELAFAALAVLTSPLIAADADSRQIPLIEDGKIAPGWKHVGWGAMKVEGDVLATESDARGLGVLVYTKEKLGNCQIRIVYRPKDAKSNAGAFIRMDNGILDWIGKDSIAVSRDDEGNLPPGEIEKMREASETENGAWYAVHHGYEVQMCDTGDPLHRTGAIYSLAPSAYVPPKEFSDKWRTMIITLSGNAVHVEQDGMLLSSFDPASKDIPPRKIWHEPRREPARPQAGYFGLQTHDPGDVVYFKEVSVRPLKK